MKGRGLAGAFVALALVSFPVATALGQSETDVFSVASLDGDYIYRNTTDAVLSFGVIDFDGAGKFDLDIRVNSISTDGGRATKPATGSGTYTVNANGIGTASLKFDAGPVDDAVFDFVIVSAEGVTAEEVFAVSRSGGVNNQAVNPIWTRRTDANDE